MSLARRRRFWGVALRRRTVLLELALALVVAGAVAANAFSHREPLQLLLLLGALPPIFIRRDRPYLALLLAVAAGAVVPGNRTLVLPVMAVLYTIASETPWRTGVAAGGAAALVTIVAGAGWGGGDVNGHGGLPGYVIGGAATSAAAVAVGLYAGARRRVVDGLRERAERLDRERELLAERAVADERVRIAQELHDIVAHNVSLIVVEAQALGATVGDDRVTRSSEAIANLGRDAMSEMHATLKLLRDDARPPELAPQPGLSQLERLIEQSRAAGLEIELAVEGQPRPLPQGVDLSAFRIVQEALTNVLKHATGASTIVTLAYKAAGLELTVVDHEERPRTTRLETRPDGHGLIGMRERAILFGGTLSTEALPDGFKVTATLPYAPTSS